MSKGNRWFVAFLIDGITQSDGTFETQDAARDEVAWWFDANREIAPGLVSTGRLSADICFTAEDGIVTCERVRASDLVAEVGA